MTKLSTFLLCFSLLVCLLVGSSIADPSAFDDMEFTELERRQDNNSTSVTSESSSSTSTTSRTSTISTTSRTSTSSRTTSTTSASTISPPAVPETPITTSSTSTPPPQTSPTSDPPTQTPTDGPVETITPTPTTRVVIATHYTTVTSNGAAFTSAYVTSSTTIETPTGTAGQTPGGSDSGGSSGGITPATRNTIIGVVVGVGGALLFGGLAIVAWRLKRNNKNPVDEDDLMRRDGSPLAAGREMHAAGPEQSPFKATLDQYHKPPGVVNASSNF